MFQDHQEKVNILYIGPISTAGMEAPIAPDSQALAMTCYLRYLATTTTSIARYSSSPRYIALLMLYSLLAYYLCSMALLRQHGCLTRLEAGLLSPLTLHFETPLIIEELDILTGPRPIYLLSEHGDQVAAPSNGGYVDNSGSSRTLHLVHRIHPRIRMWFLEL